MDPNVLSDELHKRSGKWLHFWLKALKIHMRMHVGIATIKATQRFAKAHQKHYVFLHNAMWMAIFKLAMTSPSELRLQRPTSRKRLEQRGKDIETGMPNLSALWHLPTSGGHNQSIQQDNTNLKIFKGLEATSKRVAQRKDQIYRIDSFLGFHASFRILSAPCVECLNEISNTLCFQLLKKMQSQSEAVSAQVCSCMFKYYMFNCVQICSTHLWPGFLHTPNLLSTTRRSSNSHKTGSCFRSWQQLIWSHLAMPKSTAY